MSRVGCFRAWHNRPACLPGARCDEAAFLADYWLSVRGTCRRGAGLLLAWCVSRIALGLAEAASPDAYAACCKSIYSLGPELDTPGSRPAFLGVLAAEAAELVTSLVALLLCFATRPSSCAVTWGFCPDGSWERSRERCSSPVLGNGDGIRAASKQASNRGWKALFSASGAPSRSL